MTAHQAGGILAGFVGLWTTGAGQWRVAYWICVVPLLIGVPLIAKYLPESRLLAFAHGRSPACAPPGRGRAGCIARA
ncbi:MFS transporter, partial [Streptomyces sp. NPDC127044]